MRPPVPARVCTRVATSLRTWASCTVPRTAAPRRRASPISSTTARRLAASSEAVGSSSRRIGIVRHEHPGHVDPLLLAARERHRRERPEPLRDAEPRRGRRARDRAPPPRPPRGRAAARHDLIGRHARNHAQELADVADRVAPDVQHQPRRGAHHVHHALAGGGPGSARPAPDSCRTPRAAACSCPRRTGRPAPRTRPGRPRGSRPCSTGSVTPPWTWRVKALPRPRISSAGPLTAGAPRRPGAARTDAGGRRAPGR